MTQTKINVFAGDGLTSGLLPEYDHLDLSQYKKPDGVWHLDQQDAVLNEKTIADKDYFQAVLPIFANNRIIGAVATLYPTDEAKANTWAIVRISIIVSIICIIFVIPFSFFFSRSLTRPLADMSHTLTRVSGTGDFSARIEIKNQDEVGLTAIAFNSLMDSLQTAIGAINQVMANVSNGDLSQSIQGEFKGELLDLQNSTNQSIAILRQTIKEVLNAFEKVSLGANELTKSSKNLADGTARQAATMQEISSAMNEIAAQAQISNTNATDTVGIFNQAITSGEEGNQQMESMLASMGQINNTSNEVTKVIKVIDEIAFQTNLLALNAAVEAARSGKYGKGFAVVAEEVRNLAARSAEAAKNTAQLIENSLREVENGVNNADKTAAILKDITNSMDKSNDLVLKISASSKEQDTGVREINEGLSQVNNVIQQNSAISEESASASEELLSHANQVRQMLNRFRLTDGGNDYATLEA